MVPKRAPSKARVFLQRWLCSPEHKTSRHHQEKLTHP